MYLHLVDMYIYIYDTYFQVNVNIPYMDPMGYYDILCLYFQGVYPSTSPKNPTTGSGRCLKKSLQDDAFVGSCPLDTVSERLDP